MLDYIKILNIALLEIGQKAKKGAETNPEILKYFTETGNAWVKNDETAWCSAFVNWVLYKAGMKGTNLLNARSFLSWGKVTEKPQLADIVVLWRDSKTSWKGHVGFFICEKEKDIMVLGGNQDGQVSIKGYDKNKVLAYLTK